MKSSCALAAMVLLTANSLLADDDLLIADFESETYGEWTADGEAFGPGPAEGALSGQMEVSGYVGKRLVNSFFQGDRTTGTLTSPPIPVNRKFLNFLIGGGGHEDKTCLNLMIEGKIVRTATGPNTEPGGGYAVVTGPRPSGRRAGPSGDARCFRGEWCARPWSGGPATARN